MKRLLVNVCANSLQTFNLGDKDTTFFPYIQTIYYLLYKINIFPLANRASIPLCDISPQYSHPSLPPPFREGRGRLFSRVFRGSFAGLTTPYPQGRQRCLLILNS